MIVLHIAAIIAFFIGQIVVASLAASLAAAKSRSLAVWIPLSFVTVVLAQFAYLAALNPVCCLWLVEAGEAPYWDRYWGTVSGHWIDVLKFGGLFGVVGWIWCLKRFAFFTREPEAKAPDRTHLKMDELDPTMRDAILGALARKAAEQGKQDSNPGGA